MSDLVNISVALKIHTCTCGSVYAIPHWLLYTGFCPLCLRETVNRLTSLHEEELENAKHLERRITSLKGAMTKLKEKTK